MVVDTPVRTIRYSREELLKFQYSEQRTSKLDWSHIDSILNPTSHQVGRRISTKISSRLSSTPKITRLPSNLITLSTYGSITEYKQTFSSEIGNSSAPKMIRKPSNLVSVKRAEKPKQKRRCFPATMLTNCQSLTDDKIDELKLTIDEKSPKIIMLTESWLTDDKELSKTIENFTLHTSNRSDRIGGGVAMFTHSSLDAKVVKRYTTKTLSSLWVKITNHHQTVIYGCIYHPKSKRKTDTERTIKHLSETITDLSRKHSENFIIGGDYNHLDMTDLCNIFNLTNIVSFPTRRDAYLDKIFTNITDIKELRCEKLPPLGSSDHDVVFVPSTVMTKPETEYFFKLKITPAARMNIERDVAMINWNSITTLPDVQHQAHQFQKTMSDIVNTHCPVQKVKKKYKQSPWFDSLATKLKNAKKKAYSKGCPTAKVFGNLLKKHIKKRKKQWITTKLSDPDPKSIWSVINTVTGKTKAKTTKPYYNLNGSHCNRQQTAEKLNEYFSTIGGTPGSSNMISNATSSSTAPEVHIGQVKQWLNNIDTKKATHSDDYPSWVSKMCSEYICVPLCSIINKCFSSGIYPDIWKLAEVVPLEKSKSVTSESDFRPISLLWHLGKILERAMMFFYVQSILPSISHNQYAYQKGKSTVDAVISAIDSWTSILDDNESKLVHTAFIDMSKAFDKMDRGKLLEMLKERGMNIHLLRLVQSFLDNRHQTVRVGTKNSSSKPIQNGAPQGTILGPMFWLVYIDTLELPCTVIKYADDLTLISNQNTENECGMQQCIETVASWCETYNMQANAKKSCSMRISNKYSRVDKSGSDTFSLKHEQIPSVSTTKFLGITIDDYLSFDPHINKISSDIRPLKKRAGIPQHYLTKYYTTCIRPKMSYMCAAWFPMASSNGTEQLTRLEKLILKIICPTGDDYQERLMNLGVVPITSFLDKSCSDYMLKIQKPEHCLNGLVRKPKQTLRRSSRNIQRQTDVKCRTQLRSSTLLYKYSNQGCVKYF